ncbi:MAG TPA: cytochrome c oxidase subunit 3 [Saprospiraceae bacterium]|nr:cytochrome c oxidase subunit 3 [Saprospiraceae bacterium]
MSTLAVNKNQEIKFNPQLFGLWLGMASIIMLFGALTSAYIVKQGASNWLNIQVPSIFYVSTAVILLSSLSLHIARNNFRKANVSQYRKFLYITFILALSFLVVQYNGWAQLFSNGVDLKSNVAGSFFYLITGAHAAHILGGIGALIATIINAHILSQNNNESRKIRVEMLLHYWHFLGILWVYLLGFILYIK